MLRSGLKVVVSSKEWVEPSVSERVALRFTTHRLFGRAAEDLVGGACACIGIVIVAIKPFGDRRILPQRLTPPHPPVDGAPLGSAVLRLDSPDADDGPGPSSGTPLNSSHSFPSCLLPICSKKALASRFPSSSLQLPLSLNRPRCWVSTAAGKGPQYQHIWLNWPVLHAKTHAFSYQLVGTTEPMHKVILQDNI